MEETALIDLTNPPFTFKIGDKELQVKKASITQLQQFFVRRSVIEQNKELSDESKALEIASYAIFIILHAADNSITESWTKENIGGLPNPVPVLIKLGFIDPQKVEFLNKLQEKLTSPTTKPSSQ